MSINFYSKCLGKEETINCGAMAFGGYRIKLSKAIDEYFGFMYKAFYGSSFGWENGCQVADCFIDITDYINENITVEDKPLLTNKKVNNIFDEIKEWIESNGGALYDLKFNKRYSKDKWYYHIECKLSWKSMLEWMEENLSDIEVDFFLASDCEGKRSKKECKKLYKTFSKYNIKYLYRDNYFKEKDLHKMFLNAYKKCWKNKKKLKWI